MYPDVEVYTRKAGNTSKKQYPIENPEITKY